ncbi:MAG: ABC transporter ATP-binding protein [Candidatus Methanomethylophilaceae archaeon]|nr:ABC transporter ATP-binding protein [Candidatus Methanomethylophilaceae archaeon]
MELRFEGMSFSYASVPVLQDVCLELERAQFISIIGPNGVGKSTLIHCINKILSPTAGTVLLDGIDVSEYPQKEIAKHVGYVPYTSSDTFPLTVVDTVLLGRHPHASWRTSDEDLEMVYTTLRQLEIEDLAMRHFNELSAGQHQKVMLARGLVQCPDILLLDEPTSNLDIKHQLGISRLLKHLSREKGIMVIMISHDLNIAARYSDNIIMMHKGGIYAVGTPKEVMTKENIMHVYGVDCDIVDDGGRPHMIMKDDEDLSEPVPQGARCTTILPQDSPTA